MNTATTLNRMHTAPDYFFDPTHPLTVALIGAGGTGSHILNHLANLNYALNQMGHPGLLVKVYDDDVLEPFNIGRQSFQPFQTKQYKSIAKTTNINNTYGTNWEAYPRRARTDNGDLNVNIVITATDNVQFRKDVGSILKDHTNESYIDYAKCFYWMDFGNSRDSGQFILGTVGQHAQRADMKNFENIAELRNIIDLFPAMEEDDTQELQGAGCSYEDKLMEQSLFINGMLAVQGMDLLSRLIIKKTIAHHGAFINLETGITNPVRI